MKWLPLLCLLLAGCGSSQSETGHTIDTIAAENDDLHLKVDALSQEVKDLKLELATVRAELHQPIIDHTMRIEDAEKRLNELEQDRN